MRRRKRSKDRETVNRVPELEAKGPGELDGKEKFEIGKGMHMDGTRPELGPRSPDELDGNERFEIGRGMHMDGTRPELYPGSEVPHEIGWSGETHNTLDTGETLTASTSPAQHAPEGTEFASSWAGAQGPGWYDNFQQYSHAESDPELARLEEEERRIDAAIAESERIRALKMEKAALQAKIMERRQQTGGSGSAG